MHTAELRLNNLATNPRHAAVGQMIAGELVLRHTRRWCTPEHRENGTGSLEFAYEIHANPEHWLVSGRRRGNFSARESETTTFPVMLLPQKSGHILLPGLEIRTFVPPSSTQSTAAAGTTVAGSAVQRRQVPSELDYRNHAETLLVLPDLQATTVRLSAGSSGGHGVAWLVDSERRVMPT